MCQIHLVKRFGSKLTDLDVEEFNKLMIFGSKDNADAFGLFNEAFYFKKGGKFNSAVYDRKYIKKSDFIVGHNRFSTSGMFGEGFEVRDKEGGKNIWTDEHTIVPESKPMKRLDGNENHHPFVINDLMLVHNGIIQNAGMLRAKFGIKSAVRTDSYVIIWLISHYLAKELKDNPSVDRLESLCKSIQKTTKKLFGSYSCALYDSISGNLLYFKNYACKFHFTKFGKDILVGSTDDENLDYVYFGLPKEYLHVRPNMIYLVGGSRAKPLEALIGFDQKIGGGKEVESPSSDFTWWNPFDWMDGIANGIVKEMRGVVNWGPSIDSVNMHYMIPTSEPEEIELTHNYSEKGGKVK